MEMVFGNRDARSATGVCFSRNPATGEPGLYGEFLVDAQGEDVVAGTRTPEPIERMRDLLPRDAYDELEERSSRRSRRTTATCRMSSSRSSATGCYILQTRSAKRTACAAATAAVALVDEGMIDRARGDPTHRRRQRSSSFCIRRSTLTR